VRSVAIVGAGQSALVLGLGLLARGYEVTLVSNRNATEIATGPVLSSQCMFESALQIEKALGLDFWAAECPAIERLELSVTQPSIRWSAPLDWPAGSVDQRLKLSTWLDLFDQRGGTLTIREASVDDLEELATTHDLVVVATGRGELGAIFQRDGEKSPYDRPQRGLAVTYLVGAEPRPAVSFNLVPGVGECIVLPALTAERPCDIVVFEGVIGGPLDSWDDARTPDEHLARTLELLERFVPHEAKRLRRATLSDVNGILTGRFAPTVRAPVAQLPSGRYVLGMADAIVLNDPLTGQGANNAVKCADVYLSGILEHGDEEFAADWMRRTFDRYWRGYGQWAVSWTNAMLAGPSDHVLRLLTAAGELPALATTIARGFDDPRVLFPWWYDPGEADRLIAHHRSQAPDGGFDAHDFRRALGQFTTGVTVVTTRGLDGRRVGVTANSFSSVSLEPPLVLWCLDKHSSSLPAFVECTQFAVNVLAAEQHHLSRQFATPADDKFAGVEAADGPGGIPLLDGVVARYLCRNLRQIDAGDHLIFLGEVEAYDTFEREPLVFHSGVYRIVTRHPELVETR